MSDKYEVILYDRARRTVRTPENVLVAAREMILETGDWTLRKDLTVTRNGVYDGRLTIAAQRIKSPRAGKSQSG